MRNSITSNCYIFDRIYFI